MNCDWPGNVDCESSEGNGIEVPIATFIPPFTSTESSITSTSTQSPNAESTTTSTNTKKTTKSPWWTWTETTWSWSEKPSTSWEWTPSTTTATTLATPLPNYPLTGKASTYFEKVIKEFAKFPILIKLFRYRRKIQSDMLLHELGLVPNRYGQIPSRKYRPQSLHPRYIWFCCARLRRSYH